MHLCVGAASRRVVEEAAKLGVHQIVASRRQVDIGGGYIGLDQPELVALVRDLSGGRTKVVRDHGGPQQGGTTDDGTESFDADVLAGFDALHIDVSCLPKNDQRHALRSLLDRYKTKIKIEIGGEQDLWSWTDMLIQTTLQRDVVPSYVVAATGARIAADRQIGSLFYDADLHAVSGACSRLGLRTKCHNTDWLGHRKFQLNMFDAYNVAPEFGAVEVDAILAISQPWYAESILTKAYNTNMWRRWFTSVEGTWYDRAKCAMRYMLESVEVHKGDEPFIRDRISDAIKLG